MKPKLNIRYEAEYKDFTLWFYNREGELVGNKSITGEDIEGLEFYGIEFDELLKNPTLDLEEVLEEAGGAWDDLSSFTELAFKAVK